MLLTLFNFSNFSSAQSNSIQVNLEPEFSQRKLSWRSSSSSMVDTWQVDILKKEVVNGETVFAPQIQYFQHKTYLLIDNQYMDTDYYYRIYGLDVSGNILVENDSLVLACVGCESAQYICEQRCVGPDYAYALKQEKSPSGQYYLAAVRTSAFFDSVAYVSVPYYQFVEKTQWDSWNLDTINPYFNRIWDIFDLNTLGTTVTNSQGTALIGPKIVGFEKYMGPYENFNNKRTSMLSMQKPCNMGVGEYISTFNTYKLNCDPDWSNLYCSPDPNNFILNSVGQVYSSDPTVHDTSLTISFNWLWSLQYLCYVIGNDGTITFYPCCPCSKTVFPKFEEVKAKIYYVSESGSSIGMTSGDINQFSLQRVGDTSFSLIVTPIEIEQADGTMSFDGITLDEGLYKLTTVFSDFSVVSNYFESIGGNNTTQSFLSNYLTTTIFPVPIVNSEFSVKFNAQRDLLFEYEIFDLNGVLFHSKPFSIKDGEEIIYYYGLDPGINLLSNMLVNKFTFEDGSTTIIQTIRTPQ